MDCERCEDEDKSVGTTDIPYLYKSIYVPIYTYTNLYLPPYYLLPNSTCTLILPNVYGMVGRQMK